MRKPAIAMVTGDPAGIGSELLAKLLAQDDARAIDRRGNVRVFRNQEMHYAYRHCGLPEEVIFTEALFAGSPGDR